MHPGIHIKTVHKQDQANDDQTIIDQRLFPVFETMAEDPGKYNKQDSHKSDTQNSEQNNEQYFFIHKARGSFS